MRIRSATADDAVAIAGQYAGLHADEWASTDRHLATTPEPDWLGEVRSALANPETPVFVAEEGGQLVGTVRVEFAERPYFRIAEIRRVYVAPGWRRRGIARELMRFAERVAREGGAAEVRLSVIAGNEAAMRLYRALGYGEFAIRLAKPLRDERGERTGLG